VSLFEYHKTLIKTVNLVLSNYLSLSRFTLLENFLSGDAHPTAVFDPTANYIYHDIDMILLENLPNRAWEIAFL